MKEVLAELGARPPSADDPRIDGLSPSLVLEPDDDEAVARALAFCDEENLAVVPIGGGTRLELGNAPSRLDAYLKTSRLVGVEDHIPGDLTVAVRAGTTLDVLQQHLAGEQQFLPLDAPNPTRATIGGILAVGEPGMRRRPGARPRDVLLGFEGVLADGSVVKAGGRVVKNVAGYELMKLFVGSAGTLFVMTRAFLRLRSQPERTGTVTRRFRRPSDARDAWRELRELPQPPEVAVLLNPSASDAFELEDWNLVLRFEGLSEETDGAVREVEGELLESAPWDAIRDFPVGESALVLRGQVAPARTFDLAAGWQDGGPLVAYPDFGILYSHTGDSEALADRWERAEAQRGVIVVERAPTALKGELDVFGEAPGGFELMRQIKEKMDPKGILSPGRFVGRI